ncbi:hypothetical protein TVAG_175920 [Trichomonas vaginalis G3]|uniref:Uncharacterized protein n=1 Tax=Trichomonas vaginalis (strain ATCC PRA-98 / G3) TaxID=412133 RepID=A2GK56_TRIV3|nr:hypothetical protein TVAG_175920 [Trichomonas vaginalis G3]|eukprot:XP_001295391.1 hypothetical protein [Trichomonas vaginalis G3]
MSDKKTFTYRRSHGRPPPESPLTIHLLGCYTAFDQINHSAAPSKSASVFGWRSPIGTPLGFCKPEAQYLFSLAARIA